jgi:hypothetical protein
MYLQNVTRVEAAGSFTCNCLAENGCLYSALLQVTTRNSLLWQHSKPFLNHLECGLLRVFTSCKSTFELLTAICWSVRLSGTLRQADWRKTMTVLTDCSAFVFRVTIQNTFIFILSTFLLLEVSTCNVFCFSLWLRSYKNHCISFVFARKCNVRKGVVLLGNS